MILGLSTGAFTTVHVIISLIAIASGLYVLAQMLRATISRGWTTVFLVTTIATSVTGFFFHSKAFGPPHAVGVLSLVLLAVALVALLAGRLRGRWMPAYVACAVASLYFNVFVGIVQAFGKIPVLHALAPTQTEPPFAIAQGLALILFTALGVLAARRLRAWTGPWPASAASQ
jgi:hypothetical protein